MSARLPAPSIPPIWLLVVLSALAAAVSGGPASIAGFHYDQAQHVYDGTEQTPSPVGVVAEEPADRGRPSATLAPDLLAALEEATLGARGADDLPRIAGGAVPRGPVRPNQIYGLEETLTRAQKGGGSIQAGWGRLPQ